MSSHRESYLQPRADLALEPNSDGVAALPMEIIIEIFLSFLQDEPVDEFNTLLATDTTNFAGESHVSFSPHLLRPHDEILQWCLQPFRLQTSRACAQSPITLTQICRRWREIAEATSILWSKLCIRNAYTLGHAHLLERWLYRAQDRPLSLVVSNYSDLCLDSHMSPSVILDLLLD